MTQIVNLQHTRGDTWKRTIIFKNRTTGAAIDMTGSTVVMTVKRDPEDVKTVSQATGTVLDQVTDTGKVTMTLPGTDFNVENGDMWYDVQWTDAAGTILTFMKGNFSIVYDVT